MNNAVERLDARIEAKHILKHPFYQAWNNGTLTREALQDYATQYYHHVEAFPTYISAVHAQSDDLPMRQHLLENLQEEEAGNPNHPDLWLDFAEAVGCSRDDVRSATLQAETQGVIAAFREACGQRGDVTGLAALYAYESMIPEVAKTKIAGLKNHYDLDTPKAIGYFDVHIEADAAHSADERALLAERLHDESEVQQAETAVDDVLTALWGILTGVCQRHSIN